MKTSTKQASNFRPTIGRIALALAVASAVGGFSIAPAFGDNDGRKENRDNGARNGDRHGDRNLRERGPAYRPGYRPRNPHPYYYSAPVYAPPAVYYPPQPSPGISLFFPLDVRIR
jgi:hypothetical protein